MARFEGVFIPVPTPFRGEDVAPERLASNLKLWNATPLAGYVVLGSTGEFPMLSEAERERVLVAAREAIPRDKLFIAGTGANAPGGRDRGRRGHRDHPALLHEAVQSGRGSGPALPGDR
jgi:dihydrodipicolinate synthase/N-acetylneuraminate lyase